MEDSYRLAALIYVSALCESETGSVKRAWNEKCETLVNDLCTDILDYDANWAYGVKMMVQLIMRGGKARSCENVNYVLQLLEHSMGMDWCAWKLVRDRLSDYLTLAEACKGVHQDFWLCTKDII